MHTIHHVPHDHKMDWPHLRVSVLLACTVPSPSLPIPAVTLPVVLRIICVSLLIDMYRYAYGGLMHFHFFPSRCEDLYRTVHLIHRTKALTDRSSPSCYVSHPSRTNRKVAHYKSRNPTLQLCTPGASARVQHTTPRRLALAPWFPYKFVA